MFPTAPPASVSAAVNTAMAEFVPSASVTTYLPTSFTDVHSASCRGPSHQAVPAVGCSPDERWRSEQPLGRAARPPSDESASRVADPHAWSRRGSTSSRSSNRITAATGMATKCADHSQQSRASAAGVVSTRTPLVPNPSR
ncbi:hypothetical protein [Saccharopolyspora pogona]|uniref:hypothetical protein n=1 Tax=Saccharopolyspora pogona TaxID=333966 RepID=UPI0037C5FBCF